MPAGRSSSAARSARPVREDDAAAGSRPGARFRSRQDHAITLFREARARIDDIERVDRILLELGRFYNPLTDGPIVDLACRQRVLERLRAGQRAEALALLDERLARYAPPIDDTGGPAD